MNIEELCKNCGNKRKYHYTFVNLFLHEKFEYKFCPQKEGLFVFEPFPSNLSLEFCELCGWLKEDHIGIKGLRPLFCDTFGLSVFRLKDKDLLDIADLVSKL